MKNNIRYVAGFAAALFLAACSGGASEGAEDLQAPAPPAAPSAPATTPAAPPPAPTTTSSSSSSSGGMPSNPPIGLHCNVSSATTNDCIENVQGHAGDIVNVDIYLIGDATCGIANEADGHVQIDFSHFTLMNDEELVGCRTHTVAPDPNGAGNVIRWNAFGDHALQGCADIPIGKVDTMKIRIAPGTPPGDYVIAWEDADFIAPVLGPSQCTSFGSGMSGTLRVLP